MTRSTDDRLDTILEKIEELAIGMAVMNDWRVTHTKEHDNIIGWKRWLAPFLLTVSMFCWQVFKK
jgi:hypothetical protein